MCAWPTQTEIAKPSIERFIAAGFDRLTLADGTREFVRASELYYTYLCWAAPKVDIMLVSQTVFGRTLHKEMGIEKMFRGVRGTVGGGVVYALRPKAGFEVMVPEDHFDHHGMFARAERTRLRWKTRIAEEAAAKNGAPAVSVKPYETENAAMPPGPGLDGKAGA